MTPLSPKLRFLQSKDAAEAHAKLMSSVQFEKASDTAMLQTALNLPLATNIEQSAANNYRMQGAAFFLLTLMTLGDPIPEMPPLPDKGLNYEATKIKA